MNVRIAPALKVKKRQANVIRDGEGFLSLLRPCALGMDGAPQTESCDEIADGFDFPHQLGLSSFLLGVLCCIND